MAGQGEPVLPRGPQVATKVMGNDAPSASPEQGTFELTCSLRSWAHPVLESSSACQTERISPNAHGTARGDASGAGHDEGSLSVAPASTVLDTRVVARLIKRATARPSTLVLDQGLLDEARLDEALDVLALTRGGVPKK